MKRIFCSSLVVFVFAFSCASPPSRREWNERMDRLYQTLAALLTDVTSDARFRDSKRQSIILDEIKDLADQTHDLTDSQLSVSNTPNMTVLSSQLKTALHAAYQDFRSGYHEHARQTVRSVSSLCLSCHIQSGAGIQYEFRAFNPEELKLDPLELAQFYVAARQLDKAQDTYDKLISDPNGPRTRFWEWSQAVRQSVTVAVRIERNPLHTSSIIEKALSNPAVPTSFRRNLVAWKKSADDWKTEPSGSEDPDRLFEEAKRQQRYPSDRNAEILYLRAVALYSENLRSAHVSEREGILRRIEACEKSLSNPEIYPFPLRAASSRAEH